MTSGEKEIKLLKEVVGETGTFLKGIVKFQDEHNETQAIEGHDWMNRDAHPYR